MFDIENVNRTTSQPPETFKMVKNIKIKIKIKIMIKIKIKIVFLPMVYIFCYESVFYEIFADDFSRGNLDDIID